MANTFIWNWLLLPILPLSELIKQDFGSNIKTDLMTKSFWQRICPYMIIVSITMGLWASTYPGWTWFVVNVLKADKSDKVHNLICHLVPFYMTFSFATVLNGTYYGLGRTDLLAIKSFIGNCLISTLFALFMNGILFGKNVFSIATIFGLGLVNGFVFSIVFLYFLLRNYSQLASAFSQNHKDIDSL